MPADYVSLNLTKDEVDTIVGALLYRLVALKQAVPPTDETFIRDHQSLYEMFTETAADWE